MADQPKQINFTILPDEDGLIAQQEAQKSLLLSQRAKLAAKDGYIAEAREYFQQARIHMQLFLYYLPSKGSA